MRPPSSRHRRARSSATMVAWLAVMVFAFAAAVLPAAVPGNASGLRSPADCVSPDLRVRGVAGTVHQAPAGNEIAYVCIGSRLGFPRGHSGAIESDGGYGAGLAIFGIASGGSCYAVTGVGSDELTVRGTGSGLCFFTRFIDSYLGHVDVFYRPVNQPPLVDAGIGTTVTAPGPATLMGTVSDDGLPVPPALTTAWTKFSGPGDVLFDDDSAPQTTATFTEAGLYRLRLTASDGELSAFDDVEILVEEEEEPPTGPEFEPSALNNTAATDVGGAMAFLYSGDNPIQTGVEEGAILRERTAVVHGFVFDRDTGEPLPGAEVSILGHPEWGQTLAREDGRYDMALNGDGFQVVTFRKDGYIRAQRQVFVEPQKFTAVPDIALVAFDPASTVIDLGEPGMKVARGSVESDADGTRQATLLFPEGVTAALQTDGGPVDISTLTIRLTEFTVGEDGPIAMPAELPPASKYTYALEFSADEAGETGIEFSTPLPFYVENFVGFPVGETAPLGYYDHGRGLWVALPSGIVLKIVGEAGGVAEIDIDGDDSPDDVLTALGITGDERSILAEIYEPGQSLWRVEIPHFSTMDINWAKEALDDLKDQIAETIDKLLGPENCTECPGSSIELENQVLGETIGLTGVPASLHYSSSRFRANNQLSITVTGPVVPANLIEVEVSVNVAGQVTTRFFEPVPNQRWTFDWDGLDGYGRPLSGAHNAVVIIDNKFIERYASTSTFGGAGISVGGIADGGAIRRVGHINKRFDAIVSAPWRSTGTPVGGWSLSQHHLYDPRTGTLYLGTGERIEESDALGAIRDTASGHGTIPGWQAQGTPVELLAGDLRAMQRAADGGWWVESSGRLIKVDPHGIATVVVQDLTGGATDLDVGPRGEVYVALQGQRIVKYDPATGVLSPFAGNGGGCTAPLTGPAVATEVELCAFPDIAATPDGNVYVIADHVDRIYRIGTDGLIYPFAMNGTPCPNEHGLHRWCTYEGVPAYLASREVDASLDTITAGPDGSIYVNAGGGRGSVVMRITPDGIMRRFLGGGGNEADGIPATDLDGFIAQLAVSPEGEVVFGYRGGSAQNGGGDRYRTIVGGRVLNISGHGFGGPFPWDAGRIDDGKPAEAALYQLAENHSVFLDDGSILFGQFGWVRVLRSQFPGFGDLSDKFIASPGGGEVWHFDGVGRHLETLHALTGAPLWTFGYDASGNLVTMTDGDGNVTTIDRLNGGPVSITGPFGDVTEIGLDPSGFLQSVSNPNDEIMTLSHSSDGLLQTLTTARGDTYVFGFNGTRQLISDADPAGGSQTLSSVELPPTATRDEGREVERSTVLGRTTSTAVEWMSDGRRLQSVTGPDGLTSTAEHANGTVKYASPTGMQASLAEIPDPRFGMEAPLVSATVSNTPGGLTMTTSEVETVTLSNPEDPFSIVSLTNVLTVNNRAHETVYDAATRTFFHTSPEGRPSAITIDQLGRPTAQSVPGLAPGVAQYDSFGRLETVTVGSPGPDQRVTTFTYDARSFLASVTDPLGRTLTLEYDSAGRLVKQTLPGAREVAFDYDPNGNLTSLTPPGRPAHTFTHNEVGMATSYVPPVVDGVAIPATTYEHNLDHQLTAVQRPDGLTTTLGYDAAGRLSTIDFSRGAITLSYSAATGQLTSITAPGGQDLAFAYTGELLTQETWSGPVAGSVGHGFDNDFRVASQTVNAANGVAFAYDDDGLLTAAGELSLAYDPANGLFTGSTLANISDSVVYTAFGEAESYEVTAGATPVYGVEFTRDALGRITSKTEVLDGATTVYRYIYDAEGQLESVEIDGTLEATYSYDLNGNRLTGPGVESATYDAQDRLLTYGPNTYTYDANGDLESKTNGGSTTAYNYDELGNLVSALLPDGTELDYVIDGAGRRVGRAVDGVLEQGWLYDGELAIVAELDGAGALVSRFVYANGINVPEYAVQSGITYRIVTDHLGSLRLVLRASDGHVVQRMNHDEFGRVTEDFVEAGFNRVPFGFAGGLYDPATGLVRFGARDYNPETGRFTAKDPIGFAGGDTNLYAYAAGDPVNATDPDGMIPTWDAFQRSVKWKLASYNSRMRNAGNVVSSMFSHASPLNTPFLASKAGGIYSNLTNSLAMDQLKLNQTIYRAAHCPPKPRWPAVLLRVRSLGPPVARLFKRVAPPLIAVGFVLDAKARGPARAAVSLTPVGVAADIGEIMSALPGRELAPFVDTPPPNRW